MQITGIEDGKGNKYRVYGDGEYLFSLYGKELKRFHISENAEIDEGIISSILDEIIYKRGKEYALYQLENRPMTEKMLRKKLSEHEYPPTVIDSVIEFLCRYHYIDDMEYIRMFVNTYSNKKSIKQMRQSLYQKGITRQDMDDFFNNNHYSDLDSFCRLFKKYIKDKNLSDWKDRQKIYQYFYSRGYSSSLIENSIKEFQDVIS